MSQLEPTSADRFRLLAECCFAAIAENRTDLAVDLAVAMEAARPDDEASFTGRAMVELARNNHVEALAAVDAGLKVHPESESLSAFRGMALLAGGYASQAEEQLQPLTGDEKSSPASNLAAALLKRATGSERE